MTTRAKTQKAVPPPVGKTAPDSSIAENSVLVSSYMCGDSAQPKGITPARARYLQRWFVRQAVRKMQTQGERD